MITTPYSCTRITVSAVVPLVCNHCLLSFCAEICISAQPGTSASHYHHDGIGHCLRSISTAIISHCLWYYHAEISYKSTTQNRCHNVSRINPPAHYYRLSYYHTDTSICITAPYGWRTVASFRSALFFCCHAQQQFPSDHRPSHLIHSMNAHTSTPFPSFLTLTLQILIRPVTRFHGSYCSLFHAPFTTRLEAVLYLPPCKRI